MQLHSAALDVILRDALRECLVRARLDGGGLQHELLAHEPVALEVAPLVPREKLVPAFHLLRRRSKHLAAHVQRHRAIRPRHHPRITLAHAVLGLAPSNDVVRLARDIIRILVVVTKRVRVERPRLDAKNVRQAHSVELGAYLGPRQDRQLIVERRCGRGARSIHNAARSALRIGVITPEEFSLTHIIAIGFLTVHGLLAGGRARRQRRSIVIVVRIAAEQLVLQLLVHRRRRASRGAGAPCLAALPLRVVGVLTRT